MRLIGYVTKIQDFKVYRKTISNNFIKHFTTKVAVVTDNELKALDGFSLTDRFYVEGFLWEKGLNITTYGRYPRYGNAIFLVEYNGEFFIPRMSRDIVGNYEERVKFYMKPLLKQLKISLDDIRVIDQNGNLWEWGKYKPTYFPNLKTGEYIGEKPDLTVLVYDMNKKQHRIDIFGNYYVYTVKGYYLGGKYYLPLFVGYVEDLVSAEIIPPIETVKVHSDMWRLRSETRKTIETSLWVKLTEYEWCGAYTQSQERLEDLFERLKENIGKGYDMVTAVIHYTSNIFVTYIDLWVRGLPKNIDELKYEIAEIRDLELREIIENIFMVK